MFTAKTITCVDCSLPFTFAVEEQAIYASKGFGDPRRCESCREARKARNASAMALRAAGPMPPLCDVSGPYELRWVTCASCGREARVLFVSGSSTAAHCSECSPSQRG